jgi:thymidylate synthase (FAD)
MFTEFIETGSLAAYARLYSLRNAPDAQKEIREYAQQLGELIQSHFPVSWRALTQDPA